MLLNLTLELYANLYFFNYIFIFYISLIIYIFFNRKVASISGDARRALALCARALEIAHPKCAGLQEVQVALGEAASSAAVRAIKCCSPAERLMLRAVAAEVSLILFDNN